MEFDFEGDLLTWVKQRGFGCSVLHLTVVLQQGESSSYKTETILQNGDIFLWIILFLQSHSYAFVYT